MSEVKFSRKTAKMGRSQGVTIPKELCEYLGIELGDTLLLSGSKKSITITKG